MYSNHWIIFIFSQSFKPLVQNNLQCTLCYRDYYLNENLTKKLTKNSILQASQQYMLCDSQETIIYKKPKQHLLILQWFVYWLHSWLFVSSVSFLKLDWDDPCPFIYRFALSICLNDFFLSLRPSLLNWLH